MTSTSNAAECLRIALGQMTRHGVPPTPRNYAVWYEYAAGTNAALRTAIDRALGGGDVVDACVTERLFDEYLAPFDEARFARAREALNRLASGIQGSVEAADGEVGRYEASLTDFVSQLGGEVELDGLRDLVDTMARDTRAVRASSAELRQHLQESRKEAESLRAELERVKEEAITDALTGLANRKAFDRIIGDLVGAGVAGDRQCSLLMVDIDHFKRFNDTYGHLLGDKVIRFVGNAMRQCVKGRDTVARYGGEEFAVILPDTPLAGALAVAETIRGSIEAGRLVRTDTKEPIGNVTVSIGASSFRPGELADDFIKRADEALYRAKGGGRNRVEPSAAPTGSRPPSRATGTSG
ncbi:MAG: diguanylate cyclase [Ectothiorhodospiraceae bacterium]|nr:diguanylate cyclase [Chromatiales bacterium]MCP5154569.1 diguanylate cyclase [Ectothiorhodospiraceae bacterium]